MRRPSPRLPRFLRCVLSIVKYPGRVQPPRLSLVSRTWGGRCGGRPKNFWIASLGRQLAKRGFPTQPRYFSPAIHRCSVRATWKTRPSVGTLAPPQAASTQKLDEGMRRQAADACFWASVLRRSGGKTLKRARRHSLGPRALTFGARPCLVAGVAETLPVLPVSRRVRGSPSGSHRRLSRRRGRRAPPTVTLLRSPRS